MIRIDESSLEFLWVNLAAGCGANLLLISKSVIAACFKRESRRDRNWTPDPFDTAQGRGEHSRTTIKTFGGDALEINLITAF